MGKPAKNGTAVYTRQHSERPTLPQLSAIDLLVVGKTDTETAALLSLNRTTVTKWRMYDPVFQAELNLRRVQVWQGASERLRSLIPKAVDVIGQELDNPETRFKAALELFRLVPPCFAPIGPTDPEQVLQAHVTEERERIRRKHSELAQQKTDELFGALSGAPSTPTSEELLANVKERLKSLASDTDEATVK